MHTRSHPYNPGQLFGFLAILCLWMAHGAFAQYVRDESKFVEDVDFYHEAISKRVVRTANNVDEFFATDRILEESNESQIRLNTSIRYEDGKNLTARLSLKGRISLPNLEDRFQLFIDTDARERDLKDQLQQTTDVTNDDKSIFTGVRFVPRETRRSRVNLDGGLRWRGGPVPFARVRGRRTWTLDEWLIRGTQVFFWFSDRGFGETTSLDFERNLDAFHFFRSASSATWSEISSGVDLQQRFSLYHTISEDGILGFDFTIEGHTHPSAKVEKYETTLRWRQRSYREWMFFEVAPGLLFRRDNEFTLTPVLTLKLEVLFGDPRFF